MSETRRKKLSLLTRSIARGDFEAARGVLRTAGAGGEPAERKPREPVDLLAAAPGEELAVETPMGPGRLWLVRRTIEEVSPDDAAVAAEYVRVLRGARQRFDELTASAALCHVADGGPDDLLFMDTETCGFAGSPVFLVGVMYHDGRTLVFEQLLARDYSEEPAMLAAYVERCVRRVLVTFNGKSFDMNMLRERAAFHGLEIPEPIHLDLLHESRRLWKKDLPNCRLQTLERYLCGRRRVGDIPGGAIPDAYHRFVDTGDATQLRDILHHNLLDLLTMAQIVCAALTGKMPGL